MASNGQPYQGYPYVNVSYIDAPSIDSATASQWANLPVRPSRGVKSPLEDDRRPQNTNSNTKKPPRKSSIDQIPVVYIDLPGNENNASIEPPTLTQEDGRQTTNKPDFIPDTVYYNPYDDSNSTTMSPNDSSTQDSGFQSITQVWSSSGSQRVPPSTLNENSPASSSSSSWDSPSSPQAPSSSAYDSYLSKETQVYSPSYSRPNDGFELASIPVEEFPAPPPAYSEVDRAPVTPVVVEPAPQPAPTQVIVNVNAPAPSIPANPHRQLLDCQHCGARVYTLVIKQSGVVTHTIAFILLLFCLLPLIYLVYHLDYCKYRNHYCPNCNQLIGYEVCCQKTVYAK